MEEGRDCSFELLSEGCSFGYLPEPEMGADIVSFRFSFYKIGLSYPETLSGIGRILSSDTVRERNISGICEDGQDKDQGLSQRATE